MKRKLSKSIKKEIIKEYSTIHKDNIINYMNRNEISVVVRKEFFNRLDKISRVYVIDDYIIDKVWSDLVKIFMLKKKNDPVLREYLKAHKQIQNFKRKNADNPKAVFISKIAFREIRAWYDEYLLDNSYYDILISELAKYNYKELKERMEE